MSELTLPVRLQPFLQDFQCRNFIEKGASQSTTAVQAKLMFSSGLMIGTIEAIAYLAISILGKGLNLLPFRIDTHKYLNLTKGAASAIMIAAIGIWNTQQARDLIVNIKKVAIGQGENLVEKAVENLENVIDSTRNIRANEVVDNRTNLKEINNDIWFYQKHHLIKTMKNAIASFKRKYTRCLPTEKHAMLQAIQREIKEIEECVSTFALTKSDKGYYEAMDQRACIDVNHVIVKLKKPSQAQQTAIDAVKSVLKEKLHTFVQTPDAQKETAFKTFSREIDALYKEEKQKMLPQSPVLRPIPN